MIKDNQRIFNRIFVLIDILIVACSIPVAYFIKFRIISREAIFRLPFTSYLSLIYVTVPLFVLIYFFNGVYEPMRTARLRNECLNLFRANCLGMAGVIVVIFVVFKQIDYSRWVLALFFLITTFGTIAFRIVLRKLIRYLRKNGYNQKHMLLIGYSHACEELINRINGYPQWGYSVFGILDDGNDRKEYRGVKVIGTIDSLSDVLADNDLDEVAITLSLDDYDKLERVVNICEKAGVHTQFVPDYSKVISSRAYTEDLLGLPLINIRYVPLSNAGSAGLKRLFDIILALAGIIITSPLMLVIAILVKTTSKGPVIFKQERIGLHNKSFFMYKFRSMRIQTAEEEKEKWTTKDDPRVTKVGKFIRRTSIDELPQLFNILKGDMSLVGPRPERPQFVDKFKEEIPRYMIKHQVRPGLTGWAQVKGFRGDTSIEERIKHDIYYIENWTFGLDIKIIFMTFFTGFVNKNAY